MDASAKMLDYAIVDCERDPDEFAGLVRRLSGVSAQFERGNPGTAVAGMSGVEIAAK